MITIDREARQMRLSPLNIDLFRETYTTENNLYIFSSPSISVLEKNIFFLIHNSEEIPFEVKYKYRPDYLSFDKYGTIMLWEMLLYVNGVPSIEDFNFETATVIVPHYTAVMTILQDRFVEKDLKDLRRVRW